MHQAEWIFEYPDVEVKESSVKLEIGANDHNSTAGTSNASTVTPTSTPGKRSSTESLSKSPKKQKMENDSMGEGSENGNGTENGSANGEGSRTPVTRSTFVYLKI